MSERLTVYTISPSPDSAVAVEIKESGLRKRKHLFVFERYSGELFFDPERPLETSVKLRIETASVNEPSARKLLAVHSDPEILIESRSFLAKALRGFVAGGTLRFRGADHDIRANIGFGPVKNGRVHIDADSTALLSRLGLPRRTSLFGLIHTDDEAVLHASLWGNSSVSSFL
ncbi:MAG: YceI family protein [Acidobacteriota bacterium]|nr:YceI family protein [Acidobacteriota bacterium]